MPRYRLDKIAALARQMAFAPFDVRVEQIDRAEDLIFLIEPTKAYPLDFVIFKITGYRPNSPATGSQELLAGAAVQHDLGLLVDCVTEGMDLHAADSPMPVLQIEDVCQRLGVTSKTIQRWRRRGLPSRQFIFADGRKRVGFLLGSVERFLALSRNEGTANFTGLGDGQLRQILRRSRMLAPTCTVEQITHRLARHMRRSPLTILHTLRKHDQENPQSPILPQARPAIAPPVRAQIAAGRSGEASLEGLSRQTGLSRRDIYWILLEERAGHLLKLRYRFFDDPLYHGPEAAAAMSALTAGEELPAESPREQLRIPRDLPACLQDLYRTPLLSPARERALFLAFNYHKYLFAQARRRIDPEYLTHRQLAILEKHLHDAREVKKQIVQANLRLVASVARKHLRPGIELAELLSDGNVTLMRAVESFDVHRGNRFSTYATLSLMKGYARSVPAMHRRPQEAEDSILSTLADPGAASVLGRLADHDELERLLKCLNDRERCVLRHHFGLEGTEALETYERISRRMGISRERVRQIELGAIEKLRAGSLTSGPAPDPIP